MISCIKISKGARKLWGRGIECTEKVITILRVSSKSNEAVVQYLLKNWNQTLPKRGIPPLFISTLSLTNFVLLAPPWSGRHNSETSPFRDYESLRGGEPVANSEPFVWTPVCILSTSARVEYIDAWAHYASTSEYTELNRGQHSREGSSQYFRPFNEPVLLAGWVIF